MSSLWARRPDWLAPIGIWLAGIASFWLAILWVKIFSPDWIFEGFMLRPEGSDGAWQTIRLWEMWSYGPSTLWWEHIYPPLYDGIRYLFMLPETSQGLEPSTLAVDFRLYLLHSVLFGLTAMIVYLWVRDLTTSGWWALFGAALWCAVPASLAYYILMYQTGLAISAMAVAFYLLYRFSRTRRNSYAIGFLVALLIASLTRNVVQIHVFVILVVAAFAFWWIGRPRRWWMLIVNLLLVALIGFWPARAYVLYSTFDVSTHTGYNRVGALWLNPAEVPVPDEYPANINENAVKLSSNWNTQETLKDNYRLGKAADEFILTHPLEATRNALKSLTITVPTLFRSVYVQWYNGHNWTFPFMPAVDWIFSSWRFALLILAAAIVIIRHFGMRGTFTRVRRYRWFAVFWLLTAIPVLLSNRYWPPEIPEPTHSEADRLRALIDVPVYVLMTFAAFLIAAAARRRWRRGKTFGDARQEMTGPESD